MKFFDVRVTSPYFSYSAHFPALGLRAALLRFLPRRHRMSDDVPAGGWAGGAIARHGVSDSLEGDRFRFYHGSCM